MRRRVTKKKENSFFSVIPVMVAKPAFSPFHLYGTKEKTDKQATLLYYG